MAVAVDVTQVGHLAPETAGRVGFHEGVQDPSIVAREDVSLALARGSGDDVGDAVGIDVSGSLDADAELASGGAGVGPELGAGSARIHVDSSGPRSLDVLGRRRRGDVVDAVTVDVPDVACYPAELVSGGFSEPLAQNGDVFQERVGELGFGGEQREVAMILSQ